MSRAEASAGGRAAILAVGIVGVLIAGLQPQLLGALEAEGRIGNAALGLLASAELLTMGIGAALGGALTTRWPLRWLAAASVGLLAIVDLATPSAQGVGILVARLVAGAAEGVLIGITIAFVVRTAAPARWSGLYLAAQTLAQFAMAWLLGGWVLPQYGAAGAFRALAAVTALTGLAVPFLPIRFAPLSATGGGGAVPPRGLLALGGVLLFLAFVVAVWVFLEPIARAQGIGGRPLAAIAPLSLVAQVAGAAVATLAAGRVPPTLVMVAAVAADLAALAIMAADAGATAFLAASAVFGFVWLFAMPFQVPLVIAADPSRRAAALIGGAQLIGSSAGPLAAGLLVGGGPPAGVLAFGALCALLALAALVAAANGRGPVSPDHVGALAGEELAR